MSYIISVNAPRILLSKCALALTLKSSSLTPSVIDNRTYCIIKQDALPARNSANGLSPPSVPPLSDGSSTINECDPFLPKKRSLSSYSRSTRSAPKRNSVSFPSRLFLTPFETISTRVGSNFSSFRGCKLRVDLRNKYLRDHLEIPDC